MTEATSKSIPDACFEYLLSSWINKFGLAAHQIASYDKFLENKISEIVNENSNITIESEKTGAYLSLKFLKIFIRTPSMKEADGTHHRITPHECRMRGLSYNLSIYTNILQEYKDSARAELKIKEYYEVFLCKIPCMVGSSGCCLRHGDRGECKYDPGGYFIVNGNEKGQDKNSVGSNIFLVFLIILTELLS